MNLTKEQQVFIRQLYKKGIRSEWRITLIDKHILEQMNNYPNMIQDVGSYLFDIDEGQSSVIKTDIPWHTLL